MKVILQKDVAKLGRRYAVVDVPDGYALNKLIPQKMALPASSENLKRIQNIEAESTTNFEIDETMYREAIAELSNKKIEVMVDANAQGHLFKAVKNDDIHQSLIGSGITVIPKEAIIVSTPIKSCGEHIVGINFHNHRDDITILVVTE